MENIKRFRSFDLPSDWGDLGNVVMIDEVKIQDHLVGGSQRIREGHT